MIKLQTKCRGGLTLVELLVVVTILVLLIGVVLPLVQPVLQGREIREAGRLVNTYLAAAQAQAVATGSPVGVRFELPPTGGRRSFQMSKVRVPPRYMGDTMNWRVGIDVSTITANTNQDPQDPYDDFIAALTFLPDANALTRIMRTHVPVAGTTAPFQIQFGFGGPNYQGVFVAGSGDFIVQLPTDIAPPGTNLTANQAGLPFAVTRPPKRGAAAPVELPIGAYIDLGASGFLDETFAPVNAPAVDSVTIMFDEEGRLGAFYGTAFVGGNAGTPIVGPLDLEGPVGFLIANTKEEVVAENLLNTSGSIWVAVHPSGRVATSENIVSTADVGSLDTNSWNDYPGYVGAARNSVLTTTSMGGR